MLYKSETSIRNNRLFENFMNSKLGFALSVNDYLRFGADCGIEQGADSSEFYQRILSNFKQSYNGTVSFDHYRTSNPLSPAPTIEELFQDGVYKMPQRTFLLPRAQTGITYALGSKKPCDMSNGFTLEFRAKHPISSRSFANHEISFGSGFYATFTQTASQIRFHQFIVSGSNLLSPQITIPTTTALSEWRVFKCKITRHSYSVYLDGELLKVFPRDSTLPIQSMNGWISFQGDAFEVDWLRFYNASDELVYNEEFLGASQKVSFKPGSTCPPSSTPLPTAFVNYFNQQTGRSYTYTQIDSAYKAVFGSGPLLGMDTASVSADQLGNILSSFKKKVLSPVSGYADLDMRTLAGTLTPDEGPKGVFDVLGELIGNTADGTKRQIKESFVEIWNSSPVNQAVGELHLLGNDRFRLVLNPGQQVPCQGIVGMRYFQFNVHNTRFWMDVPKASYFDFGDGIRRTAGARFSSAGITFNDFDHHGGAYFDDRHYMGDAGNFSGVEIIRDYPDTTQKTVTVYHSDNEGCLHIWEGNNNLPYGDPRKLKNLRGYFPENIRGIYWGGGSGLRLDSTFLSTANIRNFKKIRTLQYILIHSARFNRQWARLDDLSNNKDLRGILYIVNANNPNNGDSTDVGLHEIIPNASVNFPKLSVIQFTGGQKSKYDSLDFKGKNLRAVHLSYLTLDSSQIDRMLIELARNTSRDSGHIATWSIGGYRTSASDSAYNALIARGWRINLKNSEPAPVHFPKIPISDSTRYPIYNELTDYFNAYFGTSLSVSQLSSFYERRTGKPLNGCMEIRDSSSVTSEELSELIKEYQKERLIPAAGFVDLDMRTLAGTLTPSEGPKGVFDVNGNLIGNTADTTEMAVKASYVQIWNSSTVNQVVGTLSLLSNGRFRLTLNPGQQVPCQGIVGMRYYELDVTGPNYSGIIPRGTYVDFGDGNKGAIYSGAIIPGTSFTFHIQTPVNDYSYAYTSHYNGDVLPFSGFTVHHLYSSPATGPLTVYHSELGSMSIWNFGSSPQAEPMKMLKGYLPQYLSNFEISNGYDSAYLKIDSVRNYKTINGLHHYRLYVNKFTNANVNLADLKNNRELRRFIVNLNINAYSNRNNPNQYPFYHILPQQPENFPKLGFIQLTGISKAHFDSASFAFPKLRGIGLSYLSLDSVQVDRMLIELARNTQMDSGVITCWSIGGYRTVASDSAYNSLIARHWKIGLKNSEYIYDPYVGAYPVDTTIYPLANEFTDYFNARFGTNLLRQEIDSFYKRRTGALPNACVPDSSTQHQGAAMLCGRSAPVFASAEVNDIDNCSDSTFFAVSVGTELFRAYSDSLRGYFDSAYLAKCLGAVRLESFTVTHEVSEYHHTLYYYDQAGNLIKTVPPAGVRANYTTGFLDSVAVARKSRSEKVPAHELVTQYRYNSLNQVTVQHTPDGGLSSFWYDRLGRLSISQNAKQKAVAGAEEGHLYSYTRYDQLGRITEVGEIGNAGSTAMSAVVSRDPAALESWLTASAANRSQITTTVYDLPYQGFTGITPTPVTQWNLRNRVSYTSITHKNNPAQYNQATFYSYDIHGNVDTLLQDFGVISDSTMNVMNANGHRFKKLVYHYDLISGKVNQMEYQPGFNDLLIHRYTYDAENRLVTVETSVDSLIWEKEARYEYYKHGPLARLVLGQNLVQGIDYAYTLQGWLKGVNSLNLDKTVDMGMDGDTSYRNGFVARDQYGFSLNYYGQDYEAIKENVSPFPSPFGTLDNTQLRPLYNGNIAGMAESIRQFGSTSYFGGLGTLYSYRYDQLNRIKGMRTFTGFNVTGNSWIGAVESDKLLEEYRYDANGNILQLLRNGHQGGGNQRMDSLNYHYYAGTNRLKKVSENVPATRYITSLDLDPQPAENNYTYDEIGNLLTDESESITYVKWNVYGKISEIHRTPNSSNNLRKITYTYDASGNRISSLAERDGASNKEYRWYVRDAQGNVLALYTDNHPGPVENVALNISERYSYGSGRLGYYTYATELANGPGSTANTSVFNGRRGSRRYELSNHLGNVLLTVTDRKIGVPSLDGSLNSSYEAAIVNAQSYYPFGMMMPGRGWNAGTYRYGFNGKENDNEVKGVGNQQDYGMRIYDPRVGRFLSVDPLTKEYAHYTPYSFAGNKPIIAIDLDGEEEKIVINDFKDGKLIATQTIDAKDVKDNIPTIPAEIKAVPGVGTLTIDKQRFSGWGIIGENDYNDFVYNPDPNSLEIRSERVYTNAFVQWGYRGSKWTQNNINTAGYGNEMSYSIKAEGKASGIGLGEEAKATYQFLTYQNQVGSFKTNSNINVSGNLSAGSSSKSFGKPSLSAGTGVENFSFFFWTNKTKDIEPGEVSNEKTTSFKLLNLKIEYTESQSGNNTFKLGLTTKPGIELKTSLSKEKAVISSTTGTTRY